jgi:hypothetical protein
MEGLGCRICGWLSPLALAGPVQGPVEVAYVDDTVRVTMATGMADDEDLEVEATLRNGVLEVILKKAGW